MDWKPKGLFLLELGNINLVIVQPFPTLEKEALMWAPSTWFNQQGAPCKYLFIALCIENYCHRVKLHLSGQYKGLHYSMS